MVQAIARSALVTSLLRYRRSTGLWLILLVAPIAARFMISNEDGKGIAIAINDHLPVLTSAVLGVWLGVVVSTLMLPIGYIYLRSNTTRRQPWQVEEVTAASRVALMLGRFAADCAVLLAVLAALTVAGWVLGWLMVTGPWNPFHITLTLWIVAAPALIGLAAIRTFFDARPWLRRGAGDGMFFVLWMAMLVAPAAAQGLPSSFATNLLDFPGFARPMIAGSADGADNFVIGGADLKPGRVNLDAIKGISAPGYAASRLAWIVIAVLIAALSGLVYAPHTARARKQRFARLRTLFEPGPPRPADPAALPAPASRWPLPGLVASEFRLIGAGRLFKLLAAGIALAGLLPDFRHVASPAALLLLAFALSAHAGRSEAKGLLALTGTALHPPLLRRAAFVLAGTCWALLMALPAITVQQSGAPLLLALGTGLAASLVAITLSTLSHSGFAARMVLLIAWYVYFST